jgi:hypothetical protein
VGRRMVGIAVLIPGLVLVGCGGGTSPEDYAAAVCNSTGDWIDSLQGSAEALQDSVNTDNPEEAKQLILDFLDDTINDTDELLGEVEEAGSPDVDGGEEFADDVTELFDQARDALANAQNEVEGLPTDDVQTFSQKASELGSLLGQVMANFEPPRNEEMEQAFEDANACSDIGT